MNLLAAGEAVIFGVLAGVLVAGAIGRWVYAIVTTVRPRHVGGSEHRTRPLIWALPIILVLHSTPWLLAIVGWVSYYFLSRPHASWLHWFFGGLSVSLVFMAAFALRAWWRLSRSAARREKVGNAA